MKRRNFIIYASTTAVVLPVAYYIEKHYWQSDPLVSPELLGKFCNIYELREIGKIYRAMKPEESQKEQLINLLLTNYKNQKSTTSDKLEISKMINQKIHDEFVANKTILIKGWFISITEARQCALISLLNQNQE
jgi:hypothetical protein